MGLKQKWSPGCKRSDREMMYPLIILSLFSNPSCRRLRNISSFIANLGHSWTSGRRGEEKKTSLEEAAGTKSHSNRGGAPFYFLSKKRMEALHLSPWLALSGILLYVNSVYLSCLQGNAASASDSEMRHFSTNDKKKGKRQGPALIQRAAEWKLWRHRRASMATRLLLSLLGAFQEPHNEKKTTAILHGAGRASGTAAATRCSRVITLAVDEGDDPLAN